MRQESRPPSLIVAMNQLSSTRVLQAIVLLAAIAIIAKLATQSEIAVSPTGNIVEVGPTPISNGVLLESEELASVVPESRRTLSAEELSNGKTEALVLEAGGIDEAPRPDPSGLTREQKIEHIMFSHEEFQNSLSDGGRSQVLAEQMLATKCAIAIMRESGRAIYDFDVDNGERRAFRPPPPSPDIAFAVADNAKYLTNLYEFPAVRLARERNALLGRGQNSISAPPLTPSEMALYESLVDQAYKALGVNPK